MWHEYILRLFWQYLKPEVKTTVAPTEKTTVASVEKDKEVSFVHFLIMFMGPFICLFTCLPVVHSNFETNEWMFLNFFKIFNCKIDANAN